MTQARTPKRTARPETPRAVAPDPEALRAARQCADMLGAPEICRIGECSRAGRCRGAWRPSRFFATQSLPPCYLDEFEELYAPVAEWNAFVAQLDELVQGFEAVGL
jgi:hypothetical protein